MILRIKQHPVPVLALLSALCGDQRANPHRFPNNYPLSEAMAAAHRFDASGRTLSEYEALTAFVEKWARRKMNFDAICDECGERMDKGTPAHENGDLDFRHLFTARFTSYFVCSQCAEIWFSEFDPGLSRITGLTTRYKHEERWTQEGKAKLQPLQPSGALFAGLVISGGSEPITVPLRAGDGALPNVSRILNTFRFDLTEVA
jgi:hypothetical protein